MEVKDGVAIIRIDGPGKMNTIDDHFRQEIDELWTVRGERGSEGRMEFTCIYGTHGHYLNAEVRAC